MAHDVTGTNWASNVGAFEAHYIGWRLDSDGIRYSARRKVNGRAKGPTLKADSLDELAALIDAEGEGSGS